MRRRSLPLCVLRSFPPICYRCEKYLQSHLFLDLVAASSTGGKSSLSDPPLIYCCYEKARRILASPCVLILYRKNGLGRTNCNTGWFFIDLLSHRLAQSILQHWTTNCNGRGPCGAIDWYFSFLHVPNDPLNPFLNKRWFDQPSSTPMRPRRTSRQQTRQDLTYQNWTYQNSNVVSLYSY